MKLHLLATLLLFTIFTLSHANEGKVAMHGQEKAQNVQMYYGKILEIKNAMGYKYLKVDENGTKLWVAISSAPIDIGDTIGYDKQTIMTNFMSKTLNQEFDEIIFASELYLPQKNQKPKSMKEQLAIKTAQSTQEIEKEIQDIPFVEKETYSIEEIHMWRKSLQNQIITLEAKVTKVSHQIMKLDWVHLNDGSGNAKKGTNDLVFTASNTSLKQGDSLIATGKVIVDKDFGFGYFYKVIIQDASFEVK